ncbi:hypothetical protein Tco_0932157 [Tanacetum coccineum]
MKTGIREICLINLSLGQCKRAKQRALFDYERGLKEHYGRLWEYRQAILDSNPGSTCELDDEETSYEDLNLQKGEGLTIISDSHKGLLEGVNELLPNIKHRKCTRHVFANFKTKFSGVQLQCLFWNAASTIVEQLFYSKMEELKITSQETYQYLIEWNPNSWDWMVIPSGFQELEVRKGHEAYRFNIHLQQCHNKASCQKEPVPKPPKVNRAPVLKPPGYGTYASARGKGNNGMGESGGAGGRAQRGRGWIREAEEGLGEAEEGVRKEGAMTEDEIRKRMEHESFETQESVAANLSDKGEIGFRLGDFEAEYNHKSNAELELTSAEPITIVTPSTDKGKQVAKPSEEPNPEPQAKKKGSKRKVPTSSEEVPLRIIFHKNRGRL